MSAETTGNVVEKGDTDMPTTHDAPPSWVEEIRGVALPENDWKLVAAMQFVTVGQAIAEYPPGAAWLAGEYVGVPYVQVVPPSDVDRMSPPVVPEPAAKQSVGVGQLTPSIAATPGGIVCADQAVPLVVPKTLPVLDVELGPTDSHVVALAQEIAVTLVTWVKGEFVSPVHVVPSLVPTMTPPARVVNPVDVPVPLPPAWHVVAPVQAIAVRASA